MTQDVSTRGIGVASATALHLAVGWALWSLTTTGAPMRSQTDEGAGRVMSVRVVSLGPSGAIANDALATGIRPTVAHLSHASAGASEQASPALRLDHSATGAAAAATAATPSMNAQSVDLPNSEVLAYRTLLETHLARYRVYPVSARQAGSQGVVTVHFVSDRTGKVVNAWIETSSGVSVIDDEALEEIARAQPLPPFPSGWPDKLDISLPLIFRLG